MDVYLRFGCTWGIQVRSFLHDCGLELTHGIHLYFVMRMNDLASRLVIVINRSIAVLVEPTLTITRLEKKVLDRTLFISCINEKKIGRRWGRTAADPPSPDSWQPLIKCPGSGTERGSDKAELWSLWLSTRDATKGLSLLLIEPCRKPKCWIFDSVPQRKVQFALRYCFVLMSRLVWRGLPTRAAWRSLS